MKPFLGKVTATMKAVPGLVRAVRLLRDARNRTVLGCRRIFYPLRLRKLRRSTVFRENSVALMTVFILKENILFLEEWIDHHFRMGVDHFFLYDNSKVEKRDEHEYEKKVELGKVNKHGRDYDNLVTDDEAQRILSAVLAAYPGRITIIPWEKLDEGGFIRYFQREALLDFLERAKGIHDYCLFIDMDEFLVSRQGLRISDLVERMTREQITTFYFKSRLFSSRFNYVGKAIRSISMCLPHDREDEGFKTLFRVAAVVRAEVHCTTTLMRNEICPNDEMLMYHYCHNSEATLIDFPSAIEFLR